MKCIFIDGNVPSSKNSRVFNLKRRRSFPSKSTSKYLKLSKDQWIEKREEFLNQIRGKEKPYKIGMFFIRDSKRRFDANNASQVITDLMAKNQWIEDDNIKEAWPVYLGFKIDKTRPGIYILVLDKIYDSMIENYVKIISGYGKL